MNRMLIAIAVLALAAPGVSAQTSFEGNEYEGANERVAGDDPTFCPPTGSIRYRVQVRRDDMVINVIRSDAPQPLVDTTPINRDGTFGRTRQFPDGSVSISSGRIEAERLIWDIKVQRGAASCVLRAELARVAARPAK